VAHSSTNFSPTRTLLDINRRNRGKKIISFYERQITQTKNSLNSDQGECAWEGENNQIPAIPLNTQSELAINTVSSSIPGAFFFFFSVLNLVTFA
jgi:hypothetical protein